ncbi:complex I NDUFA9 subunit family protein [Hirschia baltica]|uniref:NAD-dependent epimerase/dehydratase n=1 Tax=Hirschia baltica (strain ATCC 49814 / DSM 5838 / IFAM 1418) TaxID=582402 RepID=C6XLK4_HIRBI|nr:complex I NDUFA9 subunit family protein [Hirschia baltica]ACT57910.1 NAD-dependent epimerase/dehydratase [Hirschia baltica ATCC 49814]
MSGKLITVFGGSGFIGRYAVRALCKAGWRVRVAVRNPMNAGDMRIGGEVGQVQIIQANVRNRPSIVRALDGADAVLNLVGLLYQKGRNTFDGTQALGAQNIAEYAADAGIKQFIQLSAIGADLESNANYARTKAEAEQTVLDQIPTATILRPSLVFGPEDQFFNKFATFAKFLPFLPLVGGGKTKFQPVFVGDLADAIVNALSIPETQGRTYEIGGPRTYTFKELLEFITEQTDRKKTLLPIPFFAAELKGLVFAGLFKFWPFHAPPITRDQVRMLKSDNIVGLETDKNFGTIEDLGVTSLETVEAIVPTYLWRHREYGQFHIPEKEDVSRVDI